MTRPTFPPLQRAVIMLDFDGTLVDLAPTPKGITIPSDLAPLLSALDQASQGLTLISGRAVAELTVFLPDFQGDIYGSHGGEWRVAGTYGSSVELGDAAQAQLWSAADSLAAALSPEIISEHKPAGAVIHYRQAPKLQSAVEASVTELAETLDGFEVHQSKMAVELRPKGRTKADAAKDVMTKARDAYAIFAGDDTTDEDAIGVVNAAGGLTIKIGDGETSAGSRSDTPDRLRGLLQQWLNEGR